jgi:hypothetical protein
MTTSLSSPLISSLYNHGWSRLIYNNPTTIINDQMMRIRLFHTTPSSFFNKNFSKYRKNFSNNFFIFFA